MDGRTRAIKYVPDGSVLKVHEDVAIARQSLLEVPSCANWRGERVCRERGKNTARAEPSRCIQIYVTRLDEFILG